MEFVKEFVTFLHQKEIIKFGDFTLASGKSSSYYVDLRLVPSYPHEFRMMVKYLENQITEGAIDSSDEANPTAPNEVIGNVNQIPSSPSYNNAATSEAIVEKTNVDNIDIPAFLRQQAD